MYNEWKSAFSLNLCLQHVGATPPGLEDARTPALPQTFVLPHLGQHTARCCLYWPLTDSAAKRPQVVGKLVELDVWKSENFQEWVNHQVLPSLWWRRICCTLALWRWIKCLLESWARLVTVHSIQPLPLSSSCATFFSALSLPVPRVEMSHFSINLPFWDILQSNDWKLNENLKVIHSGIDLIK